VTFPHPTASVCLPQTAMSSLELGQITIAAAFPLSHGGSRHHSIFLRIELSLTVASHLRCCRTTPSHLRSPVRLTVSDTPLCRLSFPPPPPLLDPHGEPPPSPPCPAGSANPTGAHPDGLATREPLSSPHWPCHRIGSERVDRPCPRSHHVGVTGRPSLFGL
jgi:hypothetical protein